MANNPDNQGYPKLDVRAARALNPRTQTIRIESILGGQSAGGNFSARDQFQTSVGIDPSLPVADNLSNLPAGFPAVLSSGYLRPSSSKEFVGTAFNSVGHPLWMRNEPKVGTVYVLDSLGSIFSLTIGSPNTVTAIADGGSLTGGHGNGFEYYDNYMYIAKDTDIARYGPLDGAPILDGSYWVTTLGKAALTQTTYPIGPRNAPRPNHILHRHSDGKLYIGDVVGNQGNIHVISTSKTSVEGDTDNGSAFGKLSFGYGLHPTAMESYGSSLAIALSEGNSTSGARRAKLAFWDTTSNSFNSITWVEFPDNYITAMKNVNGVLYIASGSPILTGFRVSRYVGGNSFEDVTYQPSGFPPMPGAMDGNSKNLFFGTQTSMPLSTGGVFSLNLRNTGLAKGIFNIMRVGRTSNLACVFSVFAQENSDAFRYNLPYVGWLSTGVAGTGININSYQSQNTVFDYSTNPSIWWSQVYRIGQSFKITKIRLPLGTAVTTNTILTVKIYTDDGMGTVYTYQTINNTNYPGQKFIVLRSDSTGQSPTGNNNFFIELTWTGADLCTVALPIKINYELNPADE